MKPKNVQEMDSHFLVDDGKGSFRVPKNGLSEAMQAKIRAMAPQKMADGGAVSGKEFADSIRGARYAGVRPGITADPDSVTRALAAALERTGMTPGPEFSLEAGEPSFNSAVSDVEASPDNVSYISQEEAQSRMPYDASMDPLKNAGRSAWDYAKTLGKAAINPLGPTVGALDALAEARKTPGFSGVIDSAGSALRSIAPNLLGTAEAATPSPPQTARRPPGEMGQSAQPQQRGNGSSGRPRMPPGSSQSDFSKGMASEHGKEMYAMDAQAQAQIAADNAKAEVLKNQNAQMADLEVQRQGMAKTYQQTYDNEFQKFRNLTDKYSKSEIDPGKFWASRSTGDKVLAAIGLAMGAIGSQDGVNRSVSILNQAIERDIDAQKANLDAAGKAAGNQMNLLGIMRSNFSDQQQAHNATEAAMRQRAISMLDETALRFSGPEKQAAVAAMKAKLGQDYLQNVNKTEMAAKLSASEAAKNWAQVSAARSAGQSKEQMASSSTHKTMSETIGRIKSLVGDTNIITEKAGSRAAEMQSLAADLLLQVKEAAKLGALDKGSIEIAEKLIGDPSATFTLDSTKIARLNSLLSQSRRKAENMGASVPPEPMSVED